MIRLSIILLLIFSCTAYGQQYVFAGGYLLDVSTGQPYDTSQLLLTVDFKNLDINKTFPSAFVQQGTYFAWIPIGNYNVSIHGDPNYADYEFAYGYIDGQSTGQEGADFPMVRKSFLEDDGSYYVIMTSRYFDSTNFREYENITAYLYTQADCIVDENNTCDPDYYHYRWEGDYDQQVVDNVTQNLYPFMTVITLTNITYEKYGLYELRGFPHNTTDNLINFVYVFNNRQKIQEPVVIRSENMQEGDGKTWVAFDYVICGGLSVFNATNSVTTTPRAFPFGFNPCFDTSFNLTGYVRDIATKEPIDNATLFFHAPSPFLSFSTVTDSTGFYSVLVTGIPYNITISQPEFFTDNVDKFEAKFGINPYNISLVREIPILTTGEPTTGEPTTGTITTADVTTSVATTSPTTGPVTTGEPTTTSTTSTTGPAPTTSSTTGPVTTSPATTTTTEPATTTGESSSGQRPSLSVGVILGMISLVLVVVVVVSVIAIVRPTRNSGYSAYDEDSDEILTIPGEYFDKLTKRRKTTTTTQPNYTRL